MKKLCQSDVISVGQLLWWWQSCLVHEHVLHTASLQSNCQCVCSVQSVETGVWAQSGGGWGGTRPNGRLRVRLWPPGGDVRWGHACSVPTFHQGILSFSPPPTPSAGTLQLAPLLSPSPGGTVRRGVGGSRPQGPQPAPVHPAGAEGRAPWEERAQGQSLPAAGGAGLLQKVPNGQNMRLMWSVAYFDWPSKFHPYSDETEEETVTPSPSPSPELRSRSRSSTQPESGIKRLYVKILKSPCVTFSVTCGCICPQVVLTKVLSVHMWHRPNVFSLHTK